MHPSSSSVEAYVEALEAERMKMMMFKSELPLSIDLVSQSIESCKGRLLMLSSGDHHQQQQQQLNMCDSSSEETTSDDAPEDGAGVPVLEFIPIKKVTSGSEEIRPSKENYEEVDGNAMGEKLDWLSSAQLWNKSPNLPSKSEELRPDELESLGDKCKSSDKEKSGSPKKAESSSAESEKSGGCKKDDKESGTTSKRKQRRCWSQDLHRRFLHSLKQLGGAHVATPKQIRELMKVDGLTNDEVKSHLQKYRLHTRRPSPPPSQNKTQAPPQFVVVGSIWGTPPSDYTNIAFQQANREGNGALGTSRSRVYTPMAAPMPTQPQQWKEPNNQKSQTKTKNTEGHGDGLARCISPSMSSSTRTTASQVY